MTNSYLGDTIQLAEYIERNMRLYSIRYVTFLLYKANAQ